MTTPVSGGSRTLNDMTTGNPSPWSLLMKEIGALPTWPALIPAEEQNNYETVVKDLAAQATAFETLFGLVKQSAQIAKREISSPLGKEAAAFVRECLPLFDIGLGGVLRLTGGLGSIETVARAFCARQTEGLKLRPEELDDLARRLLSLFMREPELKRGAMASAARKNKALKEALRHAEAAMRDDETSRDDDFTQVNDQLDPLDDRTSDNAFPQADAEPAFPVLPDLKSRGLEVFFAYHWPKVFEAWKLERRPTAVPRWPAMLSTTGGLAPLYGRTLGKVQTRNRSDGLVEHVIVSSKTGKGGQLRLNLAASVKLPDKPTTDQILAAVASVTGNRVFRFFGAVLVAMSDDAASGLTVPGGFFYRPGRFADLMGVDPAEWSKDLDRCLHALTGVSLTASLRVGGKPYKVQAESLIIDGGGTLEATGERGRGRPKARLFRVQDFVLQLLGEQAAWFPFSRSALAPPPGVDQRVWDDAFKVYLTLGSFARLTGAKPGKPWRNEIAKVLEVANVTKPTARPGTRREKLEELCGHLHKAKLLNFEMTEDHLVFDLPAQRTALETISARRKPSKQLPSVAG